MSGDLVRHAVGILAYTLFWIVVIEKYSKSGGKIRCINIIMNHMLTLDCSETFFGVVSYINCSSQPVLGNLQTCQCISYYAHPHIYGKVFVS
jgi:hypothetical protein